MNDVVTVRTPSCVVHLDISTSTDCILSHRHGSRKWIMLSNSQRWACKDSPTFFAPLLLLLHFAFVLLKYVFLWEKNIWGLCSLGNGMVLWAFLLLLLSLLLPVCVGGCPPDVWQVQRRADSTFKTLLTLGSSALPFPKSCANWRGYLASTLLGRGNLFLACQPFSWSLTTFRDLKGRQAQARSTSMSFGYWWVHPSEKSE